MLRHNQSGIRFKHRPRFLRSPAIFAACYLFCIPIFAILYCTIASDGFYAPYAAREPARYADESEIVSGLAESLCKPFDKKFSFGDCEFELVSIDDKEIDGMLMFWKGFFGPVEAVNLKLLSRHSLHMSVWGKGRHTILFNDGTGCIEAKFVNESKVGNEVESVLTKSSEIPCAWEYSQNGSVTLKIDTSVAEKIDRFNDGIAGNASSIGSEFPRMLYFSTITIATIGYGDIIPITPWARALVALEAILGLTFAGLFLSSLYDRIKPTPDKR